MTDCVFCKIVAHEIPANFVYEGDDIVAFKDIKPSAPLHYLIVPREHIPSIMHLEENHQSTVSAMVIRAKELAAAAGLKGYKLVFNVGREGGQIVDHLHLHLLGGWEKPGDARIAV